MCPLCSSWIPWPAPTPSPGQLLSQTAAPCWSAFSCLCLYGKRWGKNRKNVTLHIYCERPPYQLYKGSYDKFDKGKTADNSHMSNISVSETIIEEKYFEQFKNHPSILIHNIINIFLIFTYILVCQIVTSMCSIISSRGFFL